MEALKATVAREISKESVTEAVALAIHDRTGAFVGQEAKPTMVAGDFYFRPNAVTRYEKASWLRRVLLRQREKVITTIVTSIVMSCPFCGMAIMTAQEHHITSKRPLTIDKAIACPYAQQNAPHSFKVTEGNIIAA